MPEITQLLDAAATGNRQAAAQILPLVYGELRKLAAARMAAEAPGHTLNGTALVRWPTGTGSMPGPGSARPWKNNPESVRHFSPGWGIVSRPHPGGEPWPSILRERNPSS